MKLFTGILAIYILGLSFVTCNDSISNNAIVSEIENYIVIANQHPDDNHIDLCSPFCFCQCCQVNIDNIDSFPDKVIFKNAFTQIFSHHANVIQDVTDLLLQPPQV